MSEKANQNKPQKSPETKSPEKVNEKSQQSPKKVSDIENVASVGNLDKALMDVVKKTMDDMKNEIMNSFKQEIREAVKSLTDELSSTIVSLEYAQKDIENLKSENAKLNKLVHDLETQIDKLLAKDIQRNSSFEELLQRQVSSEMYSRRENLLFYGVQQTPNENCAENLRAFLHNSLKIEENIVRDMKFRSCHRTKSKATPAPIICRFGSFEDRMTVWKTRSKLGNTAYSMSEDFPREVLAVRKVLYPIMKAARNDGKKAYLNGQNLEIDGKIYSVKNLHTLPEKYNPANLATVCKNDITAFYSKSSPLSNFYSVDLKLDDHNYTSVEQYFQEQKALFAGKPDIAKKIKLTLDPAVCKRLGDEIAFDNQNWLPRAKQVMEKACFAKFTQNPIAKICLTKTGNSELVEAGTDRTWGVGIKLNDPKVHNKTEHKGENLLGKILMSVRDQLCK